MDLVNEIVDKVAGKKQDEGEEQAASLEVEGVSLSDQERDAAADVLDVLDPYGSSPSMGEPPKDETPLQKKQREIDRQASEERRKAKAEILGKTLKAFFMLVDAGPHVEGGSDEE